LPSVSLRLLGAFQILHHGAEVSLGRARLEELVAWLAIHPGTPRTRTQIAYIFWPDSSEKQARTNVRNLIFRLKKRWPDVNDAIAIDRTGLVWRQDAAVEVDVQRFQALHAEAEKCGSADDCVRILTEAVNCYQGDLLPECYDDWALTAREQLRSSYAKAMEQLIDSLLDR
jgi:DNA-binding SARP family transcriptional activator